MNDSMIVLVLAAVALAWGFWLIFKRDLMSVNLGKLLAYFAGVIITLLLVYWITTRFLPWWALRLLTDTQQSGTVIELQEVTRNLFNTAIDAPISVTTPPRATPAPPTTGEPAPTVSPITPTEAPSSGQSLSRPGERVHLVQSGDTIYRLSQNYGVTQDAIRQRNGLPNDNIRIGQQLIIPTP